MHRRIAIKAPVLSPTGHFQKTQHLTLINCRHLTPFMDHSFVASSSPVQMWQLNHKEGWAPKNWCFLIVVQEKILESLLDCKDIKPVNLKGNQSWIFTGRTVDEAEAPVLWPPDAKSQLIGKDPDAGKDWRQKEKGTIKDKMAGWHHRLNGHEFEQAPGVG